MAMDRPERPAREPREGREERRGPRRSRRKVCAFCVDKADHIDYKDVHRRVLIGRIGDKPVAAALGVLALCKVHPVGESGNFSAYEELSADDDDLPF